MAYIADFFKHNDTIVLEFPADFVTCIKLPEICCGALHQEPEFALFLFWHH